MCLIFFSVPANSLMTMQLQPPEWLNIHRHRLTKPLSLFSGWGFYNTIDLWCCTALLPVTLHFTSLIVTFSLFFIIVCSPRSVKLYCSEECSSQTINFRCGETSSNLRTKTVIDDFKRLISSAKTFLLISKTDTKRQQCCRNQAVLL